MRLSPLCTDKRHKYAALLIHAHAEDFKSGNEGLLVSLFPHAVDRLLKRLIALNRSGMAGAGAGQSVLPPGLCRGVVFPRFFLLFIAGVKSLCGFPQIGGQAADACIPEFLRNSEKCLRDRTGDCRDISAVSSQRHSSSKNIFKISSVKKSRHGRAHGHGRQACAVLCVRMDCSACSQHPRISGPQDLLSHLFFVRNFISEFSLQVGGDIGLCASVDGQENRAGRRLGSCDGLPAPVCQFRLDPGHMPHHIEIVLEHPRDRADSGRGAGIAGLYRACALAEKPDTQIHRIARQRVSLPEAAKRCRRLFFVILLKSILGYACPLPVCTAHGNAASGI